MRSAQINNTHSLRQSRTCILKPVQSSYVIYTHTLINRTWKLCMYAILESTLEVHQKLPTNEYYTICLRKFT